jgi:hypothetical protein
MSFFFWVGGCLAIKLSSLAWLFGVACVVLWQLGAFYFSFWVGLLRVVSF